jgi:hypothetical protein
VIARSAHFLGLFAIVSACAPTAIRTEASDARATRVTSGSSGTPVDPSSQLPVAVELAGSDDGAVSLRAPLGRDGAIELGRRIVGAIVSKTPDALASDLEETVEILGFDPSYPMMRTQIISDYFIRGRVKPYEQLDAERVFRAEDVQLFAARELGRAGRPARPSMMTDDELMIRVRVQTPRVGTDTLFDDELLFVVARSGDQLKVRALTNLVPN